MKEGQYVAIAYTRITGWSDVVRIGSMDITALEELDGSLGLSKLVHLGFWRIKTIKSYVDYRGELINCHNEEG